MTCRRIALRVQRLQSTNRDQSLKIGAMDVQIQNLECDNRTLSIGGWEQQQRHRLEMDHMQQQILKLKNKGAPEANPDLDLAFDQAQQQMLAQAQQDELGEIFDDDDGGDGGAQEEPAASEPVFTPLVDDNASSGMQGQSGAGGGGGGGSFFGSFTSSLFKRGDVTDV